MKFAAASLNSRSAAACPLDGRRLPPAWGLRFFALKENSCMRQSPRSVGLALVLGSQGSPVLAAEDPGRTLSTAPLALS